MRDPLDRLLSAYKFWGVLHNPAPSKPTFETWLKRKRGEAAAHPLRTQPANFASQVGRPNFAMWKFSGADPALDPCGGGGGAAADACARAAFARALDTLERFHAVLPMEWYSYTPEVLRTLLGWTQLDEVHVVPSGKVQATATQAEVDEQTYARLWEENRFDYLLYAWARRVFLERLNCGGLLAGGV